MDYAEFKEKAGDLCGIDLGKYKSQQMDRRIQSLIFSYGLNYDTYFEALKNKPEMFKDFVDHLTINVSEFFRNPQRFLDIRDVILPDILERNFRAKVWSAGCSNGSEPYSIAILANELKAANRVEILATDIDNSILAKANLGEYLANDVRSMPPEYVEKYFSLENNRYVLERFIKQNVNFKRHNLLKDEFPQANDLIICRNVVIYFTEETKAHLYKEFYDALRPGGYLLVGGTEPILNYREIGFEYVSTSFYRRPLSTVTMS